MRVVALGGSGDMGRYAVRTAAQYDFVEEIVIADLELAAASESGGVRLPPLFALARGRRGIESMDVGALVLGVPAGGMSAEILIRGGGW